MNEFTKSIKAHLYDRTTSPLFGAFAFSWSVINYKLLMLIFASKDIEDKYSIISTYLYPDTKQYILLWLVYPLIASCVFIFLYPYPAKFVFQYWRKRQSELKSIKQNIDNNELLTVEESREIKKQLYELETNHDYLIKDKDSEIQGLYKSLEEANNKNKTIQETSNDIRRQLNEFQKAKNTKDLDDKTLLLKTLADKGGSMNEDSLLGELGWTKIKYDFHFGEMSKLKQIAKSGENIILQHEGKRHLSNSGLL